MNNLSNTLRKIYRHELVEVLIPANSTSTRFLIPDLPNLRDVHLLGISIYVAPNITSGPQNQAPCLAIGTVAETAFITLVNYAGKEFLKQAPASNFLTEFREDTSLAPTTLNVFDTDKKEFVGQKVNYPKSYIEFTAPPAGVTDQVFMFGVWYAMPNAENAGTFKNRS